MYIIYNIYTIFIKIKFTSRLNTHRVPTIMIDADKITFKTRVFVIMGVLTFRGPCFTTSLSTGSTARLKKYKKKIYVSY